MQVDLEEARNGLQREWHRAQAAASDRGLAMSQLEEARSAAGALVQEFDAQGAAFSAAYLRVQGHEAEELKVPASSYQASKCREPLGEDCSFCIASLSHCLTYLKCRLEYILTRKEPADSNLAAAFAL